jgi:hypothetical protein
VLLLACSAGAAHAASAPVRSVSWSTWVLEGDRVTARLVLPSAEAASLVGKAMPLLSTENLAKYVLEHVSVAAGGSPCEATDQGYDIGRIDPLSLGSSLYGFEIIFRCSHAGALSLDNAVLFAEQPQHVDFARIERNGAHVAQLFTAARRVLSIPAEGALPAAGATEFLLLGVGHAWRSIEWLCALLCFFMLARTHRELASVFAALVFGHAAALLLTAGGLLADGALLGAGMGFVVVCSAALLAAQALRRVQPAKPSLALASAACGLFAAILIFGLARALSHRPSAAWVLVGFAIMGAALVGATLFGATQVGAPWQGTTRAGSAWARGAWARGAWVRGAGGVGSLPLIMLPALAGLLDGLVLPSDYERLQQSGELSLRNLAAFDAGALFTEALTLTLFAISAVLLAGRAARYGIRQEFAPVAGDVATTVFAGLGSFWLLSRLV